MSGVPIALGMSSPPGQPVQATLTRRTSVQTLTDQATVTIACAANKAGILSTLSQPTLFANPSTDCDDFETYEIRITSASSQALTYGAKIVGTDDMPLSLIANSSGGGKTDSILLKRRTTGDKYVLYAKNFGQA